MIPTRGITPDEITYREWKKGERAFHLFLDRDLRNCIFYAWLMGFDEVDDWTRGWGGAMFELDPMEIVGHHWEQDLAT